MADHESSNTSPFRDDDFTLFFPYLRKEHRSVAGGKRGHLGGSDQLLCAECTAAAWQGLLKLALGMRNKGFDRREALDWLSTRRAYFRGRLQDGRRGERTHRDGGEEPPDDEGEGVVGSTDASPSGSGGAAEAAVRRSKPAKPQAKPRDSALKSSNYRQALAEAIDRGELDGETQQDLEILGHAFEFAQSQAGAVASGHELPFGLIALRVGLEEKQVEHRWHQIVRACLATDRTCKMLDKHYFRWTERGARQQVRPYIDNEGHEVDRTTLVSNEASLNRVDPYTKAVDRIVDRVAQACIDDEVVDPKQIQERLVSAFETARSPMEPRKVRRYAKHLLDRVKRGVAVQRVGHTVGAQVKHGAGVPTSDEVVVALRAEVAGIGTLVPGDEGEWCARRAAEILRKWAS